MILSENYTNYKKVYQIDSYILKLEHGQFYYWMGNFSVLKHFLIHCNGKDSSS